MTFFADLFPWEKTISAEKFVKQALALEQQKANIVVLETAARATTDAKRLEELRDLANAKMKDEDARQSSIISRAQGLFVALAILGTLFTFGASFLTTNLSIGRFWLILVGIALGYALIQLVLIVHNVIGAIGGVGYPTAGSSDLARWLGEAQNADFHRTQALETLQHYRVAALTNSWRFKFLERALLGLRNIVYALVLLIVILIGYGLTEGCPQTMTTTDKVFLAR